MAPSVAPMTDPQWRFLEDVFLSNAIGVSFSVRAGGGIYLKGATGDQRLELRGAVRRELLRLAHGYSVSVIEEQHIQNISELASSVSRTCEPALHDGCFRFGIAQKALNVYLKYLWCADRIPIPPHCPFDAIIIGKLKLTLGCPDQWTKIVDAAPYREWVSAARLVAGAKSLAEWELGVWQGY